MSLIKMSVAIFSWFWVLLSLVLLAGSVDPKDNKNNAIDQRKTAGQTNNLLGQSHYGPAGPLWGNLPGSIFNNIWGGLFNDGFNNGARHAGGCEGGDCWRGEGYYPFHHRQLEPFRALQPFFNMFGGPGYGDGFNSRQYNYNYGPPNYSNNYEDNYQNHDQSYNEQDEHFDPPPAPIPETYDNPPPVYEEPRPAYVEPDCSNNKCGNVVFQPIIYVGPNHYANQDISNESSEEEAHEETSAKPESAEVESNPYKEEEEHKSEEQDKYEQEEKHEVEQNNEVDHKNYQVNPAPLPPQQVYYSPPPCAQPWSQVAVPVLTYMVPPPQVQTQSQPIYYSPQPPVSNYAPHHHQTYAPQPYQSCSACNSLGSTHVSAPAPSPLSYATGYADQNYRACPELFNHYSQQHSFRTYY